MQQRWPTLFGLVIGLAALAAGLAVGHDSVEGWQLAARWTARVGFPLLIVTYCASSLYRLSPGAVSRSILRDRRWWGLGFAFSHTVHLVALVTYLRISGTPPKTASLIGGGLAYVLLYAMAFTSSQAAMRALGRNWKRLHGFGIHWLWFIFAFSYFGRTMRDGTMLEGFVGFSIALAALALRLAARFAGSRRGGRVIA